MEEAQAADAQGAQMQELMASLETMKAGGEAAQSAGAGGAALAQGVDAMQASPQLAQMLQNAPQGIEAAQRQYEGATQ